MYIDIMSRIGKKKIEIPSGVKLDIKDVSNDKFYVVEVSGPLGKNTLLVDKQILIDVQDNQISVSPKVINKSINALWGLYRTLVNNMVNGVVQGFSKELEIVGIGYRAELSGKELILSLGYSHKIRFLPPKGIDISLIDQNNIKVFGIDKQKVGEVAAKIRSFRKPEPYKGKGIRYKGEQIKRKSTKTT